MTVQSLVLIGQKQAQLPQVITLHNSTTVLRGHTALVLCTRRAVAEHIITCFCAEAVSSTISTETCYAEDSCGVHHLVSCYSMLAGSGDNSICVHEEEPSTSVDIDPLQKPSFALAARRQQAHSADVNCVRWHPTDPVLLASAGDDGCIRLWRYNKISDDAVSAQLDSMSGLGGSQYKGVANGYGIHS